MDFKYLSSENIFRAAAYAPGTCGELVQGTIDGNEFLITCPVDLWTEISVYRQAEYIDDLAREEEFQKTSQALRICLDRMKFRKTPVSFTRESQIPVGKGMGSSSADISAVCAAAANMFGYSLKDDEIADIALEVEPTDAVMYQGIVLFDYLRGRTRKFLGFPPEIDILVIDPGGDIDTVEFNRNSQLVNLRRKNEPVVRKAAALVKEGLKKGDPEEIGRGAALSASANQDILPKPELERIQFIANQVRAHGICAAHSGTVMGLLLNASGPDVREIASYIKSKYIDWSIVPTRLISGGVRYREFA